MLGDYGYINVRSITSRKDCRQIKNRIRDELLWRDRKLNEEIIHKVFTKCIDQLEKVGYLTETTIRDFVDEEVLGKDSKYAFWFETLS